MFPCNFDYYWADSLEDIFDFMGKYGVVGRILAGGQSAQCVLNGKSTESAAALGDQR